MRDSISGNGPEVDGPVGARAAERGPGERTGSRHEVNFIISYKIYIITGKAT